MTPPLDPPAELSALPSPPTSPTSPTSPRAVTARIRIKHQRRPDSVRIPGTRHSEGRVERTRSLSQSLSGIATPGASEASSPSVVAGKRRPPSITYYTPASPSPWSQRPQLRRTLSSSMDGLRDADPVVLNGRENASKRSSLVLSSRSPSARESVSSLDAAGAREREPLTLVEKHADLLRFIAQKERKCLELRDQLTAHEKELAELKRKWEHIVNHGRDSFADPPLTAGLGGAALDGLKEGVRMIAAGFSDLGGVIHELESAGDEDSSKPLTHASRETNNASTKRMGSEHLSTSSMSSIQESVHSDHIFDDGMATATVATAPSLARASSLNSRMYKRASRLIAKTPTTPTPASISSLTQSPKSADLDVAMSLVLAPSPTLVPPLLGEVSVSTIPASRPSTMRSTQRPVSMAAGSMSSWMDSMGKKLSELQKGQTFSKGQKRATVLLAGVSNTITSALTPGPTATTPAPLPILSPTVSISAKTPLAARSPSSKSHRRPPSQSPSDSRPYPTYKSMADWLDDDEEQTVHADGVLVPDSKPHPRLDRSTGAADSFEDDEWNW